ncbi:MAG: hypothetical protein ABL957_11330, partial [Parvularculaceae bacterium]
IGDQRERRIEAVRAHPCVEDAPHGPLVFKAPATAPQFAPPLWALLDLPTIADEYPGAALFAAFADPWPGAVALYREGPSGFEYSGLAPARASLGRLEADLAPAPSGRFIDGTIRLRMTFGALSSKSEAEVFAGANALSIETAAGFEVLQFQSAVLGTDGVWTLSRLLRGQKGTEDCAGQGAVAGARAVILNAALGEARYPLDARGQALEFRAGPERERPESTSFSEKTAVLSARNLRPLAPAHLKSEPVAGGRRLSFIRRTRIGGDAFESEVPLGETSERYRVSIFSGAPGAAAVRLIETAPPFAPAPGDPGGEARPHVLYTDAAILADFGGAIPPAAYFEVAQISDAVGAGLPARSGL